MKHLSFTSRFLGIAIPFRLIIIIAMIVVISQLPPKMARAVSTAIINVTTAADVQNIDGKCSLREAIINANTNSQSGSPDCAAGYGSDTIIFNLITPATIVLNSQLPIITSIVTINGPITISGNNGVRGFYVNNGVMSLNAVTVTNGYAIGDVTTGAGGGIYNDSGQVTIANSVIAGNSAVFGGGLFSLGYGSAITLTNSTVSGNVANFSGGGLFNQGGSMTVISNSTFSGNIAGSIGGGGIYNNINATVNISNSTFSGNSAGTGVTGGGIRNGGIATLLNSTLSGNSAGSGGGLYTEDYGTGASNTLINTIIANSGGGDCVTNFASVTDGGNNIVEDNSCGFTGGSDPKLGSLANNSGSTLTHALLPGSPAINAGNNAFCPATDQRGLPRSSICDIGAYEVQFPIAKDDAAFTGVNTPVTIDVLANDRATDPINNTLAIIQVGIPLSGTAVITHTSKIAYTPTMDFKDTDVFSYTISDGKFTATANVTVTILTKTIYLPLIHR